MPKIGTPAIQIDIEAEALGRNYPLAGSVLGDAKAVLTAMLAAADKTGAKQRERWIEEIAALRREWYTKYDPMLESNAAPIHPARICNELTRHVPTTLSSWSTPATLACGWAGCMTSRVPSQSYMRSAGHLGWAFSAGLRRKGGVSAEAGRLFHRRCRLLVSHRRSRDRRALEAQFGDGGQQ